MKLHDLKSVLQTAARLLDAAELVVDAHDKGQTDAVAVYIDFTLRAAVAAARPERE